MSPYPWRSGTFGATTRGRRNSSGTFSTLLAAPDEHPATDTRIPNARTLFISVHGRGNPCAGQPFRGKREYGLGPDHARRSFPAGTSEVPEAGPVSPEGEGRLPSPLDRGVRAPREGV